MSGHRASADSDTERLKPLAGVRAVELRGGLLAGLTGAWLVSLGAEVASVDWPGFATRPADRLPTRARRAINAGKVIDATTGLSEFLREHVARADVLIDDQPPGALRAAGLEAGALNAASAALVHCSVTGYGQSGPKARLDWSEATLQASAGLMASTGFHDDRPTAAGAPVAAYVASLHAVIGICAALIQRSVKTAPVRLDVSAEHALASCMDTLLPAALVWGGPTRLGNRHPSIAPSNAYRCTDGWIVVMTSSNAQWVRLLKAIDRTDLLDRSDLSTPEARLHSPAVDEVLTAWSSSRTAHQADAALKAGGVPAACVQPLAEALGNPQLRYRGIVGSRSGRRSMHYGKVLRIVPLTRVAAGTERTHSKPSRESRSNPTSNVRRPLEGITIVEVGHLHAIPAAARTLAQLGARVNKIEPGAGEAGRSIPPFIGDESYTFRLLNGGKRCLVADLKSAAGQRRLAAVIRTADALLENYAPGTLAKLGFGPTDALRVNPYLAYASVSGYGQDGPLANELALDGVIQAVSGLMEATGDKARPPTRIGPAIVDRLSGLAAAVAALALVFSARSGRPRPGVADIAMIDIASTLAWLGAASATDHRMGRDRGSPDHLENRVYRCSDGWISVTLGSSADHRAFAKVTGPNAENWCVASPADSAIESLRNQRILAARVAELIDVPADQQLRHRNAVTSFKFRDGSDGVCFSNPVLFNGIAFEPSQRSADLIRD